MKRYAVRPVTAVLCLLTLLALPSILHGQRRTPASIEVTSGSYTVSTLDLLVVRVVVADEIQLETETKVSQEGTVSLPHLGSIKIAGLSVDAVRSQLYDLYNADFYVDPHVEVKVLPFNYRSVMVTGQVNAQGEVPIPPEKPLYLLEAITQAGGWKANDLADMKRVRITRTREDGTNEEKTVDATSITSRDVELTDGDLIFVPRRVW